MVHSKVEGRPPIPAGIRRRVLVEAGHRCAIPTCRHLDIDIHHIVEWAKCQAHEYDNLIALCPNCHRRAHSGDIDRKSLHLYKANLRFAHDKFSQVEVDILFELNQCNPGEGLLWPAFNVILLRRIVEAGYVSVQEHPNIRNYTAGMQTGPMILLMTAKGREFLAEIGTHEL